MPQAFSLDHKLRHSYYAAVLAGLAGMACTGRPASITPEGLAPLAAATAASWAESIRPDRPTEYRLRWRFTTQQGSAAGRAVVRFQPADTLRFDYRAPFGRSGAALFVGADAVWAEPADEIRDLIPIARLFWAGVGLPLGPDVAERVTGLARGTERVWRTEHGGEALAFVWQPDAQQLQAQLQRADRVTGLVTVSYANGTPVTAELRFPAQAARLTFTFDAVETVGEFARETWERP